VLLLHGPRGEDSRQVLDNLGALDEIQTTNLSLVTIIYLTRIIPLIEKFDPLMIGYIDVILVPSVAFKDGITIAMASETVSVGMVTINGSGVLVMVDRIHVAILLDRRRQMRAWSLAQPPNLGRIARRRS
jgi:hypothetical protein